MSDTPGFQSAAAIVARALIEAFDPAKDAARRRRLRRLPEALALRWGARFGELPGGAFRTNPVAALTLRECLKAHAAALTPFILGGGVAHEGFHYQDVTRHVAECPGDELRPVRVRVAVDLDTGIWSAGRDQQGYDLFELAQWAWSAPGCTASVAEIEGRLLAHLGLAALDLFARSEAETEAAARPAEPTRRARAKRANRASEGTAPEGRA